MASDIPSAGFASSMEMAKVLVTYIACPHRVRRAILGEFNKAPALITIERMRREYVNREPDRTPILPHERYDAIKASEALDEPNKRFLLRLEIERALSQRRLAA